jgi:hypothetical protein
LETDLIAQLKKIICLSFELQSLGDHAIDRNWGKRCAAGAFHRNWSKPQGLRFAKRLVNGGGRGDLWNAYVLDVGACTFS